MRMTVKSVPKENIMKTIHRSAAHAGWVVCSLLAIALTGCRTRVVHEHTHTVYVPAPPPPPPAPPPVVVVSPSEPTPVVVIHSENDFYEPLAAHGRWMVVGAYGRCWIPARVEVGWRPYANGYWQRTDAGWYWASAEPWGWATYHYGRWDFHAQFGWFWVPHPQWAPAWVSWREGGGYVGWAPLRPTVTIGMNIGTANYEPAFASRAFVFVEHRRMLEPVRPKTVIVNNTTIINRTVTLTNVKVVNNTVINEGPRPEVIEHESGRKVHTIPAHEFRHREEATAAARERNIPTATVRRSEPSARPDPTLLQPPGVVPRNVQGVMEAPVLVNPAEPVILPVRPSVGQARPTSAWSEEAKPTRPESKREPENSKQTIPAAVERKAKPEVESRPPELSRREVRSVELPAGAGKPIAPPVRTHPIRGETKRERAIGKQNPATTPSAQPRLRQEVRAATSGETKPPAKVESVPPASAIMHTTPTPEKPADKRSISPRGKSRAVDQTEANRKKPEDKGPKPPDKVLESPPVVETRPPR